MPLRVCKSKSYKFDGAATFLEDETSENIHNATRANHNRNTATHGFATFFSQYQRKLHAAAARRGFASQNRQKSCMFAAILKSIWSRKVRAAQAQNLQKLGFATIVDVPRGAEQHERQSANQSINPSLHPSTSHSIDQSINQSINEPANQPINQYQYRSINQRPSWKSPESSTSREETTAEKQRRRKNTTKEKNQGKTPAEEKKHKNISQKTSAKKHQQ